MVDRILKSNPITTIASASLGAGVSSACKKEKKKKLLCYLLGCKDTIGKPISCVPTFIFVYI